MKLLTGLSIAAITLLLHRRKSPVMSCIERLFRERSVAVVLYDFLRGDLVKGVI